MHGICLTTTQQEMHLYFMGDEMKRLWLRIRLLFSRIFCRKKEDYDKGKIYPLW